MHAMQAGNLLVMRLSGARPRHYSTKKFAASIHAACAAKRREIARQAMHSP
jgi:hypothetical protein